MDRLIYSLDSAHSAREAILALKPLGIEDKQISLAARQDIELEKLPETYASETSDFAPGMKRGVALGGTTGLLAGIAAAAIPPLGITLAGGALIAVVGAAVGAWSSALAGSAIPNDLRREFEDDIAQGRVLVAVETDGDHVDVVRDVFAQLGERAREVKHDAGATLSMSAPDSHHSGSPSAR